MTRNQTVRIRRRTDEGGGVINKRARFKPKQAPMLIGIQAILKDCGYEVHDGPVKVPGKWDRPQRNPKRAGS